MAGPGDHALAWVAQAVAPGARITQAAGTCGRATRCGRAAREPAHVAYWDAVAALTTVGDMARCMPPLLDHDRPDLDARILTTRRDAFLSAALSQLDA